ncbi:hypothetical protein SNOG_10056 [Parastagonospora nodorum SN15]|uniref:Uncharacterized protein n=1 Tax=Phaeosphaeria nodorum (strain SN15 / ATCC MYA-4574 / FGSC 10173) TaxID=321614 RepID=Q0UDV8_PHANO|nr:hypothetical protein SNOG_10056 [Parastagonospora nodorum SN15]EAT82391.1 hypothetical protein SNOG_10056 [Parastagonospora nodorum SN15]
MAPDPSLAYIPKNQAGIVLIPSTRAWQWPRVAHESQFESYMLETETTKYLKSATSAAALRGHS